RATVSSGRSAGAVSTGGFAGVVEGSSGQPERTFPERTLPPLTRVCGVSITRSAQNLLQQDRLPPGFSFAALSVFRLRRAEAASAVWIPHWHSEPFESQGARAAKRYAYGEPRPTGEGEIKLGPKPRTA